MTSFFTCRIYLDDYFKFIEHNGCFDNPFIRAGYVDHFGYQYFSGEEVHMNYSYSFGAFGMPTFETYGIDLEAIDSIDPLSCALEVQNWLLHFDYLSSIDRGSRLHPYFGSFHAFCASFIHVLSFGSSHHINRICGLISTDTKILFNPFLLTLLYSF